MHNYKNTPKYLKRIFIYNSYRPKPQFWLLDTVFGGTAHIYNFTLTYYFTLIITLSIHSNSNMEVLTSNERMSATTIFLLFFNADKNVTGPSL